MRAFQTVATHPELLEADERRGWQLDSVVTISAPFGGSIIADLMLDQPELDGKWRQFAEKNGIVDNAFTKWLTSLFVDDTTPGVRSLSTPSSVVRNRQNLERLNAEMKEVFRRKVAFVTAHREAAQNDLPVYLKNIAKFLNTFGHPNDGLVSEKDQHVPELGTHLLSVSRAGHFSLADAYYGEPRCRRDFTHLLWLKLAERSLTAGH